ncbi:hypothetical protein KKG81_11150 [bacterium]|nr:hypothetical protein [bacterium]
MKRLLPSYIFQKITSTIDKPMNKEKIKRKDKIINFFKKTKDNELKVNSLSSAKILNLKKNIKSIAPFSLNGWNIYISIYDKYYEVGIYKDLGTIGSLDLVEILFEQKFIEIEKIDKHKLLIRNSKNKFILNISASHEDICIDRKKNISELVNKFVFKIENEHKNNFSKSIANSLFHNMNKIHGTIIVIQDKDRNLNDFITKGILFNKPINLFDEYLNYYNNCSSNDNIAERYYSNIGILSIILNIDGITLLSNDGQILGYNIFVDNKNVDTTNVSGGARKRAAYSIENSNIEGLVGIYFQSHDGDNYFKELN